MPVWLTFLTAIDSLAANRVRTALTMLGVIIGVAAVVTMVGLGEGARRSVQSTIRSMGTNLISVRPGSPKRRDMRSYSSRTLTVADADKIREIPGVVGVAPESSTSAQVEYLANNTHSQIVGTTPDYLSVRAMELGTGRFLNSTDVSSRRRVAILGSEVATLLFGGLDPLGKRIKIRGSGFRVIGIMAEKGDMGWYQPDNQIIVPISTYQRQLYGRGWVASISLSIDNEDRGDAIKEDVERLLRARHKIRPDADSDFRVQSQTEALEMMGQVTGALTALLGGIAAISLLVGGIGIMNIMLVAVRERTREIGVRMAVGARRRDIMLQFLVEAVVVSVLGGVVGIMLGYTGAFLFARAAGWDTIVPMYAVVVAVATSVAIGVVFGVWPARSASRLDPVEALRYE